MENGYFWEATAAIQGEPLCPGLKCRNILTRKCRELFEGKQDFAVFTLPGGGQGCLQADIPAAKDTIARIRIMEKEFKMHIAFAHDTQWMEEGSDHVLMSLLDDHVRRGAKHQIPLNQTL